MRSNRPRKLDGPELLDYALKALAARALSSGELKIRLHARAGAPEDVDEVMAKLAESGFLNDERYAEFYAAARRDNQTFGKLRVQRDLRNRKISPELARKAADQAFEGVDELEQATQFLERRYRNKNLSEFLQDPKNLASAYRRLRVAGFGSSNAIRVLKRYADRAGELEDSEPVEEEPRQEFE